MTSNVGAETIKKQTTLGFSPITDGIGAYDGARKDHGRSPPHFPPGIPESSG